MKLVSKTVAKLVLAYAIIGIAYSIGTYVVFHDLYLLAYSLAGVIVMSIPMIITYYIVRAMEYRDKNIELRVGELSKKIDKLNKTANIIDFGD